MNYDDGTKKFLHWLSFSVLFGLLFGLLRGGWVGGICAGTFMLITIAVLERRGANRNSR